MKFIHVVHCGITRTTGMNSFSRFSLRFLEQLFTTILNNFLWFLDNSWTIRMDVDGDTVKLYYCHLFYCFSLPDDLNNIIFFMAFEQFLGETSWFFGWEI
ncbi:unnamed protein product [Rhizophagus irregularis]|uniref:Uncharacterized protein n=1 Tax=Rhizophagus irregularis TaxID=588596 RepID=A0A916EFP4_9GLOM|nr:unnamed protein product [Rhizophagus irregularis]